MNKWTRASVTRLNTRNTYLFISHVEAQAYDWRLQEIGWRLFSSEWSFKRDQPCAIRRSAIVWHGAGKRTKHPSNEKTKQTNRCTKVRQASECTKHPDTIAWTPTFFALSQLRRHRQRFSHVENVPGALSVTVTVKMPYLFRTFKYYTNSTAMWNGIEDTVPWVVTFGRLQLQRRVVHLYALHRTPSCV